jgi:hypothetical protein
VRSLFLLGGYYHVERFKNYAHYMWPCFLFWGLDRLMRVARLVFYAMHFSTTLWSLFSRRDFDQAEDRDDHTLRATPELVAPDFVHMA